MIDTHCHILWGVDDAATKKSESLDMIRLAQADGIDTIVATSHIKYPIYPNTVATLQAALDDLQTAIEAEGIKIEVVLGAENFVNYESIGLLEQGKFVTYNNAGAYMLVEFAWTKNMKDNPTKFLQQILAKGITPVVAHPERYEWVHEDYTLIKKWRDMGCLMQINRTSVLSLDRIKQANLFAQRMLEDDLVDMIATDAHRAYAPRLVKLSDVYAYIEKNYGSERCKRYFEDVPNEVLGRKEKVIA